MRIAKAYEAGGAACLSVLTDEKFFQGCFDNLRLIRAAGVTCPLLCKEFIVEPYQLFKARAFGADAVLLIAAVLPNSDLRYLGTIAATLGMAVLVEVHTQEELARVMALHGVFPFMLGINNRDLGTFKVDLLLTARLLATPPGQQALRLGIPVVGESGIFTHEDLLLLRDVGVSAVLVGESIVKQADPRAGVRAPPRRGRWNMRSRPTTSTSSPPSWTGRPPSSQARRAPSPSVFSGRTRSAA